MFLDIVRLRPICPPIKFYRQIHPQKHHRAELKILAGSVMCLLKKIQTIVVFSIMRTQCY